MIYIVVGLITISIVLSWLVYQDPLDHPCLRHGLPTCSYCRTHPSAETALLKSGTLLAWDWFDLPIKDMTGLMAADGRSLSRAEYPKLFAELGVFWGFEDEEHFNLPNLSEYLVVVDEHSLG